MNEGGFIQAITAAALAAAMSSCFTGIESTPRITSANVRSAGVSVTPEELFEKPISGESPENWTTGKQWYVSDNKISLIFPHPSTGADSLAGSVITLAGQRRVPTVTGEEAIEYHFSGQNGAKLYYIPGIPAKDISSRQNLEIPFAVELSAVAYADSIMRGKTYYITTPYWTDSAGKSINGLRHIAVRIAGVYPGTSIYPLRVAFTSETRPDTCYVNMTYGTSPAATRNFHTIFAFENPRNNYPRISDANWQRIIHSQIAEGMTRDECRLALGIPASIDRGATQSAQLERWSYDDGVYLIFEDGILTRFRK